jgi:hypothetical protein
VFLQSLSFLFSYFFILLQEKVSVLPLVLFSLTTQLDVCLPVRQLLLYQSDHSAETNVVIEDVLLVVFFN